MGCQLLSSAGTGGGVSVIIMSRNRGRVRIRIRKWGKNIYYYQDHNQNWGGVSTIIMFSNQEMRKVVNYYFDHCQELDDGCLLLSWLQTGARCQLLT